VLSGNGEFDPIWGNLGLTLHVIASAKLFDIHSALWTGLRPHLLDGRYRLGVFCLLRLVTSAPTMRIPRSVALEADFMLTVRASDGISTTLFLVAVLDGEL